MRLVFRNQFLFSAHVHTKNFRNAYGSVCIQVVLQECDQHTRRSNYGVVQGMCQVFLSVLAVDTDFQTSCLCITKVGAASYLEVFLLTRRPCLNIDRFYFQVSQVTGAASRVRTGISMERNRSTVFFHSLSYHIMLSSGLQTTTISCFSNWWIRYTPRSSIP